MKRICAVLTLLALLLFASISCSPKNQETNIDNKEDVTYEVESIVLSANELDVVVGETAPLLIEVLPADLKDSIKWSSSDDTIAKYFGGEVLGKSKGSCTITAIADNGIIAECVVTVGGKVVNSGSAGENIAWTYYDDHSLVFSGTGDMEEYYDDVMYEPFNVLIPWYAYSPTAKEIIVENGITSIACFAFLDARACKKISIADSVTNIGFCAFQAATNIENLIIGHSIVKLDALAFNECDFTIYYEGTAEKFETILKKPHIDSISPDCVYTWDSGFTGKLVFYSETQQSDSWHYVDGVPTIWN